MLPIIDTKKICCFCAVFKSMKLKPIVYMQIQELREQMRDLKIDVGSKARDLLQNLKDKVKDYWKKILEKIGGNSQEYVFSVLNSFIDIKAYLLIIKKNNKNIWSKSSY